MGHIMLFPVFKYNHFICYLICNLFSALIRNFLILGVKYQLAISTLFPIRLDSYLLQAAEALSNLLFKLVGLGCASLGSLYKRLIRFSESLQKFSSTPLRNHESLCQRQSCRQSLLGHDLFTD